VKLDVGPPLLDAVAASWDLHFDKPSISTAHFLNLTYTICVGHLEFFAEHPERIAEFSK